MCLLISSAFIRSRPERVLFGHYLVKLHRSSCGFSFFGSATMSHLVVNFLVYEVFYLSMLFIGDEFYHTHTQALSTRKAILNASETSN